MKKPAAFMLLTLIALRARRSNDTANPANLKIGQALIGDVEATGASSRTYRTAKNRLAALGFATFQSTNKGTVATLASTEVFEINAVETDKLSDDHADDTGPEPVNQTDYPSATNKKQKKTKKEEPGVQLQVVFPESLNTPAFRAAWDSWAAYRGERGLAAWTSRTIAAKLSELAAMGEAKAMASIKHSISNGWQSIFPRKDETSGTTAPSAYAGKF